MPDIDFLNGMRDDTKQILPWLVTAKSIALDADHVGLAPAWFIVWGRSKDGAEEAFREMYKYSDYGSQSPLLMPIPQEPSGVST